MFFAQIEWVLKIIKSYRTAAQLIVDSHLKSRQKKSQWVSRYHPNNAYVYTYCTLPG